MSTVKTWRMLCLISVAGAAISAMPITAIAQDKQGNILDEIVVTGERFERSLLDTAVSVAVFEKNRLSELVGADRIEQVLDLIPNIQKGSSDVGPAIRGQDTTGVLIGANAFLGGTRPRATLQMDGRELNFNEFVYGLSSIWDVEQIEVFRGPQTTTQGRNAIAGAIFIDTKDPTFDFEGAAQLVVGNYDTRQASVALSGPLVEDQIAARFAFDLRQHESWLNYTAPDVFVGANREKDNHALARAKLLFTPRAMPDLELLLTYSHLDATSPQNEFADKPYEDRTVIIQNSAHWDTKVDAITVNADYAFTDNWSGELTGTYADIESQRYAPPGQGDALVNSKEYSIEGLLHYGAAGGRLRGLLGAAYFTTDQDEASDLSAFLGFGDFIDSQHSFGIFGEATLDVTPKLHMTVGGRWQQDKQDRSGTLGFVSLDFEETFEAFLPKAEISYNITEDVVIGAMARRGFTPGGTTISFVTGGIDEFDAETLWSYELFSRASLADGDITLLGNVFYTDFADAQRPLTSIITLPGLGDQFYTEFANAPSAESYGLELEGIWKVNPVLQVRVGLGLLNTEITETLQPSDPLLGREFQRAPAVTAMLGLRINPVEKLTLDFGMRHNSSYYSDDSNTPALEISGLTTFDGKATYDFGTVSVFTYVRNATDEVHRVWQLRPGSASLTDPREFGVGLETRF